MSAAIDTDILTKNKEFDKVFQDSLRLENKILQNEDVTQKDIQRVNTLISGYKTRQSPSSRHSTKSGNSIFFRRSCKCQEGKECKCGVNCQCSSDESKSLNSDDKSITSIKRKRTWYFPWSRPINKNGSKSTSGGSSNTKSLREVKRTILDGELSPNSPKDKEMMEIFSNNERHSVQDRLVFPPFDDEEISQHKRGSYVSSEDYSLIKLENAKKYTELNGSKKNKNKKRKKDSCCQIPKDGVSEDILKKLSSPPAIANTKEKKNIFDRIWDKFRLKSSKGSGSTSETSAKSQGSKCPMEVGSSNGHYLDGGPQQDEYYNEEGERDTNDTIKGQIGDLTIDEYHRTTYNDMEGPPYDNNTTVSKPVTL